MSESQRKRNLHPFNNPTVPSDGVTNNEWDRRNGWLIIQTPGSSLFHAFDPEGNEVAETKTFQGACAAVAGLRYDREVRGGTH